MLLNIKRNQAVGVTAIDEKADISQAYTKSKLFINCKNTPLFSKWGLFSLPLRFNSLSSATIYNK